MRSHDENIERLVRQLDRKASRASRSRIRQGLLEAAQDRHRRLAEVRAAGGARMKSIRLLRCAAVAAVFVAAVLVTVHLCDRPLSPDRERARIEQLYRDRDVQGLLAAVGEASYEGKLLAGKYLADIDEQARNQLEQVSTAWKGEAGINPLAIAVEYLRHRREHVADHNEPVLPGHAQP